MVTVRALFGFLAVSSLVVVASCDVVGTERRRLSAGASSVVEQRPTTASQDADAPEAEVVPHVVAVAVDGGAPAPEPGTYEAMCRHYGDTLEATLVYHCLDSGGGADDCTSRFATTAVQCVDLRCVPKLVTPGLCLVQCDGLAESQAAYCAGAPAGTPACAPSATMQNAACRAGCAVASP
jgi:hypothetical protein